VQKTYKTAFPIASILPALESLMLKIHYVTVQGLYDRVCMNNNNKKGE
jgi:hypothetical protein